MEYPYLILAIVVMILFLFLSPKKVLFFLLSVLVAITWRSFFNITSSRYCSFFLIIIFLFVCFFLRSTLNRFHLSRYFCYFVIAIFAGLLTYNTYKLFSPFSNFFIFDIQQAVNHIASSSNSSVIVIDGKEWDRIKNPEKRYSQKQIQLKWETNPQETFEKIREYSLWNGKIFLVLAENSGSLFGAPAKSLPLNESLRKIQEYKKNKNKTKVFSIYSYSPHGLPQYGVNDHHYVYEDVDNLIKNGNIETIQNNSVKRSRLKNLISAGIDYYAPDDTILPENEILLDTWSTDITAESYPKVFADNQNVINGKYSLNIKFEKDSKEPVFFLYKFPSIPGKLRFLAKRIQGNTSFKICRWDFTNTRGFTVSDSTYYLNLPDDKTYIVTIQVRQSEFIGSDKKSLFYIMGNETNLLIDDISYAEE